MMKFFDANIYSERRRKLANKVGSGLILLMGNDEAPMNYTDNIYRFRQDSSFLYFFGIARPHLSAIIDVDNDETILFADEFTMDDIIWVGDQPTVKDQAAQVGVYLVEGSAAIGNKLGAAKASGQDVHYLPPYRHANTIKIANLLDLSIDKVAGKVSVPLIKAVVDLRSIKSDEEIAEMHDAVNITKDLHMNAMKITKPGLHEYDVVAEIYRTAKKSNTYLAYPAILSIDGQTLHNHHHGNELQDGRLVLNDSGAENAMAYAGDITRTFPVNGKFTSKQKDIYNIVLEMEETSITSLKAGVLYKDIHIASNEIMLSRLIELGLLSGDAAEMNDLGIGGLFMPHGLGHMIGLDVHDMEDLGEKYVGYRDGLERSTALGLKSLRLAKELEAGNVITVEPGIYFIPALISRWKTEGKFLDMINYDRLETYFDFGGVRIEDDILIKSDGYEVLGDHIPKTIEEVENTMEN